ncbi:MAG: DUF6445 family protein [Acidimicrobiales bacterium]
MDGKGRARTGTTAPTNTRAQFRVGATVRFAGADSIVREVRRSDAGVTYLIDNGPVAMPMSVPEPVLVAHQGEDRAGAIFRRQPPHLLAIDDFFDDPDEVRTIALAADYGADLRYFKGVRSTQRFLWPNLREELSRLLGTEVVEWLGLGANGVFQQTSHDDPLVWHHDTQSYAAAVYLTPDPPPGSGTSFWRDRVHGCRRSPGHPLERIRLGSDEAVRAAEAAVYDTFNIEHPDNWELVESVAGLYNRLVVWDARLIHSATSYEAFGEGGTRLVQLFFFDTA